MKIRNQLFIFVIIMSLILTACGGKSSIGNILSDTTSPPSSETPNQSQGVSTSTSDVSIGLDEQFEPRPRPADGDFWISIISGNNADSFQQARIITLRNVKGFHILYAGDTSAKIPDITNVKLIKNGNPQDVSFTLDDTNYCEIDNSTVAIYFFDRIYTEDGIYWVEFDVDGFRATSQKIKIDSSSNQNTFLIANEGNRIVFRITTNDMKAILESPTRRDWSVKFELGGDQWSAHFSIAPNGERYCQVYSVNNGRSDWEANARAYIQDDDVIFDFRVCDDYDFDWNTINIIDVSAPHLTGTSYSLYFEHAEIVVSMSHMFNLIEIPCITTISVNPDDITITAIRNANGTLTYTYNNKAITSEKYIIPIEWYNSPEVLEMIAVEYVFNIHAFREVTPAMIADAEKRKGGKLFDDELVELSIVIPSTLDIFWNKEARVVQYAQHGTEYYEIDIVKNLNPGFWWYQEWIELNNFSAKIDGNGLTVTWSQAPVLASVDDIIGFTVVTSITAVQLDLQTGLGVEKFLFSDGISYELGLEIMR